MKRLIIPALLMIVLLLSSCITINMPFSMVMPKERPIKVSKNSVLHLKLSGSLPMYSESSGFSLFGGPTHSVHQINEKIKAAKTDKNIIAIVLEPQLSGIGRASLNELMAALNDFKTSGKKIYGYFDTASAENLLLLSVADTVYMNPSASAGAVLTGVGTNMIFFKDLLDKLGVEPFIIRAGEYKGAGEPFYRMDMSEEMRENFTELLGDLYEQTLIDFANSFKMPIEDARALYEEREYYIINQQNAISTGLVNELSFFDTMLKTLDIKERQLVPHSKYDPPKSPDRKNKVAVVYMSGDIGSGRGITVRKYAKVFDKILKDDSIKAVVLRVDSGGGSSLVSEIIYSKIAQVKAKKPIVVSLGNVAASGGYYIIADGNHIFADPYTITGSIGVFGMLLNLQGTAEKLGVNFESISYGKYANAGNVFEPFDNDFVAAMQASVMDVYDEFKTRVSEGREMSMEQVEAIAKGQIWSAKKALEHNLIDEIGGLDAAIKKAVELSKTTDHSLSYFPQKSTDIDFGFGFSLSLLLPDLRLPAQLEKATKYVFDLYDDVQTYPIQMRTEFILDLD